MNGQLRPLDRLGFFVVLMLCASWGFNQVSAKIAMVDIPPMMQATARSVGGAILIGVYAFIRHPDLLRRDGTLRAGVLSGLAFGGDFVALFIGLQWTTASHGILFLYSAPFFVALGLPWITPNERFSRLQWTGLTLSFFGVALALGVSSGSRDMLIGDALSLLAGALWAATTLIMKGSRLRFAPPEKTLLYQLVVSIFVLGAFALWRGESWPAHVSVKAGLAFAYQTVWIVSVTFVAWFWMVQNYRAGELSAFTFLTPIFGVAAGHFIMGDVITPGFALAVGLVAAGICMVNWPVKKPA
ncbi:MAG: DMT family transporter [Rhodoblastus sp.]